MLINLRRKIMYFFRRKNFERITKSKKVKNLKILDRVKFYNTNIHVGKGVTLHRNVSIYGQGKVTIGDNVYIGDNTIIYAYQDVNIGSNVLIAANCFIIDCNHGIKKGDLICNQKDVIKPVVIEDDVWLGEDVTVLMGSTIRKGAVIGAKALVNSEIPSESICVGIPAKPIKYRE